VSAGVASSTLDSSAASAHRGRGEKGRRGGKVEREEGYSTVESSKAKSMSLWRSFHPDTQENERLQSNSFYDII